MRIPTQVILELAKAIKAGPYITHYEYLSFGGNYFVADRHREPRKGNLADIALKEGYFAEIDGWDITINPDD